MRNTVETPRQVARRLRATRLQVLREAEFDRTLRMDHHFSRNLAHKPADRSGDSHGILKTFVNCDYRYCGQVAIWVGWCLSANIYECRIEGYPTVTDIAIKVRTPTSTKTLTRAARYALAFLEKHLGRPIFGTVKRGDGTYDVSRRPALLVASTACQSHTTP